MAHDLVCYDTDGTKGALTWPLTQHLDWCPAGKVCQQLIHLLFHSVCYRMKELSDLEIKNNKYKQTQIHSLLWHPKEIH